MSDRFAPEGDFGPTARGDIREFARVLMTTRPWGTWLILAVCCLVYTATALLGESTYVMLRFGAQRNDLVLDGAWWRIYSATFIHFGILHLAVNMFSLYNIGPILERFYGNLTYLALYSLCGFSGSISMLWFGGHSTSGGASGALFGLCGATVIVGLRYRDEIPLPLRRAMTVGLPPVILYNLIIGFGANQVAKAHEVGIQIGNAAHVGGLVAGVIFARVISSPKMRRQQESVTRRSASLMRVVTPLLALLAAAPFAAESWALLQALPRGTTVEHRDAQGFSFHHPASLIALREADGTVFLGDGYVFTVTAIPLKAPVDVVDDRRALLQVLERHGYHILKSEVIRGSRPWLVVDATSGISETPSRFAFAIQGTTIYRVDMQILRPSTEASTTLQTVLDTFMPQGSGIGGQ